MKIVVVIVVIIESSTMDDHEHDNEHTDRKCNNVEVMGTRFFRAGNAAKQVVVSSFFKKAKAGLKPGTPVV